MGERTCAHPGCDKVNRSKRLLCPMHYHRLRRGLPMDAPPLLQPLPERCQIEECHTRPSARGMCATHYTRFKKFGSPHAVHPGFSASGAANPSWTGDRATYGSIHKRLTSQRGRPDRCEHCGKNDRGPYQWALNWDRAMDVRYQEVHRRGKVESLPYSLDLADYIGLCQSCHRSFDLARNS